MVSDILVKISDFGWACLLKPENTVQRQTPVLTGACIHSCVRAPEIWLSSGSCFSEGRWLGANTARLLGFVRTMCFSTVLNTIKYYGLAPVKDRTNTTTSHRTNVLSVISRYSFPVDAWSIGALMFHMATGSLLCTGSDEFLADLT